MTQLRALCVYCGSSDGGDPQHRDWAADLGGEAARQGVRIIFGGGRIGLMGVLAEAALAAGGEVIGVIPEHLQAREVGHEGITRLEVVESMHRAHSTRPSRSSPGSSCACTTSRSSCSTSWTIGTRCWP
jgi:uncharacterized protein (TIGR00730 family)